MDLFLISGSAKDILEKDLDDMKFINDTKEGMFYARSWTFRTWWS